ncbi:translation elongation factor [Sinomonas atrocyanea]|uniref:Translation elongation factor n=1 Tax=Sinomonas atrocyanea TaxID=37927 RepID=A0A126ZYM6_9MICC|nr:selenocysteine-specific translation elongation factor [Sinomonas atrocyanea]AMM32203.1 translation elongation factor [Sinomonas atrocyanea]GEB64683.1 selenocysteine-specific translation elongation factor [Sinomonas atrocyanea]GGG68155.1 selenocysteine-specific translation elongation factor [Sinomonas atrocyanea]
MHVVATAGHVDSGKSTLVRALTGMEPDRWEEERRRGLTIDLGYAWTALPSGLDVAFVDVPGHERFLGNMLAGIGPAPVVCFVVAADEGWQAQSDDHRDAVAALGIEHGILVLSRADRASDQRIGDVLARARTELAGTGLRDAPAVTVSAVEGAGLAELRTALDGVLAGVPAPSTSGRVRLWVDRSFTITGSGTVVTGTLGAGTLAQGDRLQLLGHAGPRAVAVRGLQSRDTSCTSVGPVSRVALNLRDIAAADIRRGDALVTPDAWPTTGVLGIQRSTGVAYTDVPEQLMVHVGTASVPARLRPFGPDHARLVLDRRLPLVLGDRLVLRDPGSRSVLGGARVLDADPPALRRRGDGAQWAQRLAGMDPAGDVLGEVAARGAVEAQHLRRLGLLADDDAEAPSGVEVLGGWWVHAPVLHAWQQRLRTAVEALQDRDPLAPGLSMGAARDLLALPDERLLPPVVHGAGLEQDGGHLRLPGSDRNLGAAEAAIAELERRLAAQAFSAPEADELAALGLGVRELAAAERAGRVLRLRDGVVLLPTAPAMAMRTLARLEQPFTTSQARQALGTTRRTAIPLLEHLDARGWTRRLDAGHRTVVR